MSLGQKNLQELGLEFKNTGSDQSFTELYNRLKPGLLKYVSKIIKNPSDVDVIVANTFTTVHEKIYQYNPEWHISTWVYRIAYTSACMELRNRKRDSMIHFSELEDNENKNSISKLEFDLLGEFKDHLVDGEEVEEKEKVIIKLHELLEALPEKFKEVLLDRYYNNLKYEEISEKYNLPLQTIKNRIFRAKVILKEKLESSVC
jgi:RNA polymerase sigma-70 factor (ECF subfamily)